MRATELKCSKTRLPLSSKLGRVYGYSSRALKISGISVVMFVCFPFSGNDVNGCVQNCNWIESKEHTWPKRGLTAPTKCWECQNLERVTHSADSTRYLSKIGPAPPSSRAANQQRGFAKQSQVQTPIGYSACPLQQSKPIRSGGCYLRLKKKYHYVMKWIIKSLKKICNTAHIKSYSESLQI